MIFFPKNSDGRKLNTIVDGSLNNVQYQRHARLQNGSALYWTRPCRACYTRRQTQAMPSSKDMVFTAHLSKTPNYPPPCVAGSLDGHYYILHTV